MDLIEYSEPELKKILSKNNLNILYFYSKDNTPWCTRQATEFTALKNDFEDLWCQIIWVSKDSIQSHKSFCEKHQLNITLISDETLELHKQYNIIWKKNLYWKVVEWVIRSTFLLDQNWKTIKERRNIKATGHAQRVLDYIKNI